MVFVLGTPNLPTNIIPTKIVSANIIPTKIIPTKIGRRRATTATTHRKARGTKMAFPRYNAMRYYRIIG